MKCVVCDSKMDYYFSKTYDKEPFKTMMEEIGEVEYYKCPNCSLTMSKTHKYLEQSKWEKLNYDFHHYLENNKTDINQPPYLEQALLINVLSKNGIINSDTMLDYAGGYGSLSKQLKKYFTIDLAVYDPYVQNDGVIKYINKKDLTKYSTVINSALFEHIIDRKSFDDINSFVSESNGAMMIHTRISGDIEANPNWFYLEPPVHTTFHTNKSMEILMEQWEYKASIYCMAARSWILLKSDDEEIEMKVNSINQELQTEYLVYRKSFVDYWKGF